LLIGNRLAIARAALLAAAVAGISTWLRSRHPATTGFEYGLSLIGWLSVFCFGMVAYRVSEMLAHLRIPVFVDSAFVVFGLAWFIQDQAFAYGTHAPYAAAVFIAGSFRDEPIGRFLFANPVAFFLGKISYSLYLVHSLLVW